jgi:hypothetical protein
MTTRIRPFWRAAVALTLVYCHATRRRSLRTVTVN